MRRAVPPTEAFDVDPAVHAYLESLKNALDPKDFESVSTVPSSATLSEFITAHNALLSILKG